MKKPYQKVFVFTAVLFTVLIGFYSWGLTDHQFRYGDFNYWLWISPEIRLLPLAGAKPKDVVYDMRPADGGKAMSLTVIYQTPSSPQKILAHYKAYYEKLGYTSASSAQVPEEYLEYRGGYYQNIRISVLSAEKSAHTVRISYMMKYEW